MTELAKANNVVEFPREQVVRRPPPEELQENLSEKKRQFCDEVVDNFSHQVYRKIRLHGFACENKEFIAQFSYVMESLRSCLYNSVGEEHPFTPHIQDIIEQFAEEVDEIFFPDDDPDIVS